MNVANNTPGKKADSPRFVKTNIPNLVKLEPMNTYYGRCKVHGKLVRQSLETKDFKVAKSKLHKWLIDVRGRINAHEGNMGVLIEDYKKRLKLAVDSGDIRKRTRETKIQCLTQIGKVWEELFTTGQVNPQHYERGGDQIHRTKVQYKLFSQVRISALTQKVLEEWRAAMCLAYSPSRVNGAMTVFGEMLKLGVEMGMLYQNHNLFEKLGYVRPAKPKLTHLPTAEKFKALKAEIYTRAAKGAAVFCKGLDDSGRLFEFLAYSGARIASARSVKWEDVDWQHNFLSFEVTKREPYRIPLLPDLKNLLERMKAEQGGTPEGNMFKVKSIKRVLQSACRAVGTPSLTHHDLRHYFATRCIEQNIDIPTVSRWLGHQDGGALAMKTYGHLRDEHSQESAKRVHFN